MAKIKKADNNKNCQECGVPSTQLYYYGSENDPTTQKITWQNLANLKIHCLSLGLIVAESLVRIKMPTLYKKDESPWHKGSKERKETQQCQVVYYFTGYCFIISAGCNGKVARKNKLQNIQWHIKNKNKITYPVFYWSWFT